jgi:hypothetical protein
MALSAPLGGMAVLAEADRALVRQAAAKTILSEQMAAQLARGERLDEEQCTRNGNVLGRLLRQLERRAAALKPREKTLADVLRGDR